MTVLFPPLFSLFLHRETRDGQAGLEIAIYIRKEAKTYDDKEPQEQGTSNIISAEHQTSQGTTAEQSHPVCSAEHQPTYPTINASWRHFLEGIHVLLLSP